MTYTILKKKIRDCLDVMDSPYATELSKEIAKEKLIEIRRPFGYHTPCLHKGCKNWVSLAWYCKRHYRY